MGRFLNNYYKKIFNTPGNFDSISYKKTAHFLYLLCFLGILCWIVFIVVALKDSLNRLTFTSQRIENDVTTPEIRLMTVENMTMFAINRVPIETEPLYIPFEKGFNCLYNFTIYDFDCNEAENPPKGSGKNNLYTNEKFILLTEFNMTFQKDYLNINTGTFLSNTQNLLQNFPSFVFAVKFQDLYFSLNGPINVQLLFKKQINIDKNGNETVNFIPNVVASGKQSYLCENYEGYGGYLYCSENSLSIIYESNIVTIYKEETDGELALRILKDLFSIGKLLVTLIGMVVVFIQTRYLFPEQTAIFDNTIRDAVLFHFHHHEMDADLIEKPGFISSCITVLKNKLCCCFISKKPKPPKKELSEKEKLEKETEGSDCWFIRLFQGFPTNMDRFSSGLSRISTVKTILLVLIMLVYSTFICLTDTQNRLVITTNDFQDSLGLPNIIFNFSGPYNNYVWYKYSETLPNSEFKECNFTFTPPQTFDQCEYGFDGYYGPSSEYNENTYPPEILHFSYNNLTFFSTISINNDSIMLKEGEFYQFGVDSILIVNSSYPSLDTVQLSLTINDIVYFLRPFSNISVVLEKTIYYSNDSTIESFNPKIFQSMIEPVEAVNVGDLISYAAYTYIQFSYSTTYVKNIYTESRKELALRIISDIGAFFTPLKLLLGVFFTYTIVRFAYKHDTAHVDSEIREPIIYHLKYYDKYSKIYKK